MAKIGIREVRRRTYITRSGAITRNAAITAGARGEINFRNVFNTILATFVGKGDRRYGIE